jgi:hypothetical protein
MWNVLILYLLFLVAISLFILLLSRFYTKIFARKVKRMQKEDFRRKYWKPTPDFSLGDYLKWRYKKLSLSFTIVKISFCGIAILWFLFVFRDVLLGRYEVLLFDVVGILIILIWYPIIVENKKRIDTEYLRAEELNL